MFPFSTVTVGGAAPSLDSTAASFVIPGDDIVDANDLYKRNPLLLREYAVRLRNTLATEVVTEFDVVSATYDGTADEFTIFVDPRGQTFGTTVDTLIQMGGSIEVEIVPFFFRLVTSGIDDLFPFETDIQISFDATLEDPLTGNPSANPEASFSGRVDANGADLTLVNGFAADINALNGPVAAPNQTDPDNIVLELSLIHI